MGKAPYGAWKSPITSDVVVETGTDFKDIFVEEETVYWVEGRPEESGRYAIVKAVQENSDKSWKIDADFLPRGYYARTMVYEYGGGSALMHDGNLYFTNYNGNEQGCDQQLYRMEPYKQPMKITHQPNMKYAEGVFSKKLGKLLYIREDTGLKHKGYNVTEIVAIDPAGIELPQVLFSYPKEGKVDNYERDFYSSIAVNDKGDKIAWLAWNFRNMPWDSNELWVADLSESGLSNHSKVAGDCKSGISGKDSQSLVQPQWIKTGNDEDLYAISDFDNWWNVYSYNLKTGSKPTLISKIPQTEGDKQDVEFGGAQWYLGSSYFANCGDKIVAAFKSAYFGWKLLIIDPNNTDCNKVVQLKYNGVDITEISQIRTLSDSKIVCTVGAPNLPSLIVQVSILGNNSLNEYSIEKDDIIGGDPDEINDYKEYISAPQLIGPTVPNTVGENETDLCYGLYYMPRNKDYELNEDEKPPLLILAHGGPTGSTTRNLSWITQYFTSRGIAVVDMDYRGSTGYGRDYRLSLYRNWGIYDRDDCVGVAEYLSKYTEISKNTENSKKQDKSEIVAIDGDRVLARGGSAGGYLSLVLATFTNCCKAVASYYGISDLKTLTEGTHKFEAFYPYELVGELGATVKSYEMRSPINSINLLNCAMIFLQGEDDKVVPPDQAEAMVNVLKEKGKPVAEILFPGEAHGFKKSVNIKRALEAEFYFYSQVLGFTPADDIEPVTIYNKENL